MYPCSHILPYALWHDVQLVHLSSLLPAACSCFRSGILFALLSKIHITVDPPIPSICASLSSLPYHKFRISHVMWLIVSPVDRLVADFDQTIFPRSSPNVIYDNNATSSAIVSPLAYKTYDPCQFSLADAENPGYTNGNEVVSGVFEISGEEGGRGRTMWSTKNPAPVGQQFSKEGTTVTSDTARVLLDVGATALWISLLVGTISLMAWI